MKVIVGVTTTKARLGVFFYSLQSLRRQGFSDFKIVINLSKEPYLFDEGIDVVPDWMTCEHVEIRFVSNSGPYRKLLPTLDNAAEDDLIVTADDDVLYAKDWLQRIVISAESHPTHIVCGRARSIQKNAMNRFQNYSNWAPISKGQTGRAILPIGCGGIAYRKNLLDLDLIFDSAYKECAPTADDIWFRLASLRKNIEVLVDPEIVHGNSYIQHSMGLEDSNLYRQNPNSNLFRREISRLITKSKDYLGLPVSRNDRAWRKSLDYLEARGQHIAL